MQSPFAARGILCNIMNLEEDKVRVIQTTVGGAFGGKDDVVYEALGFAVLCAYKTEGGSCKYIPTREESMINSYKRHPISTTYEVEASKDGELKSIKLNIMDGGAYASVSNFVQYRNTTHSRGPYVCPKVDIENEVYYTNNVFCGAFKRLWRHAGLLFL